MKQTLVSFPISPLSGSPTATKARLAADVQFTASTGEVHLPGDAKHNYVEYALSVSGNGRLFPTASGIDSTTDSSDPNATYSLYLLDVNNKELGTLFDGWMFDASLGATVQYTELESRNTHKVPLRDDQAYSKMQTDNLLLGRTFASPATTANFGTVKITGASSTVVSTDDSRLSSVGQNITNITLSPYLADPTGVTANIVTAINAAVADGKLNIYIPAGTYTISQAQITANFKLIDLFGHNNIHIFGDGIGKTIISFPASATLFSSANTTVIAATADDIEIDGITFVGPSTVTGIHGLIVIACEGLRPKIHDNEFRNWNTATGFTTGASPITTYYPNTNLDVNTTLGTTILAGVRTVTPASMVNIYVNRLLTISGTTENVVVTDVTATTFTATFANAHSSANTVTASASAKEHALIYNNWIHDCPNSQGIVVNSSGNIFKNNRVVRVGITGLEHGFYVQAGHNVFDGNRVEGVYGYSFHQHSAGNPGIDESGNVYVNNTSLNPNTAHFQVDSTTSNGSDPIMPNAVPTERFVTIGPGNLFKNTAITSTGGIGISGSADGVMVIGNTFEDAGGFSNFWVRVTNYGSVINNTFRSIQSGLSVASYIVQGYDNAINVTISGNEFVEVTSASGGACIGVNLNVNASIIGNKFKNVTGSLFSIDGSDKTVIAQNQGNSLTLRPFAATFSSVTNLKVYENNISTTASTITTDPPPDSAVYHDNTWNVPLFQTSSVLTNGVQVWNDSGGLGGTMENGRALFLPTGSTNGAIAAASLVTLTASGKATATGTGDTQFVGIAGYSLAANSPRNGLFLGQPGTIFAGLTTDGAWTAGHVGIVSVTTAGTIHDNGGVTPPAYPASYIIFLDSGGGVGVARVLIIKTL